MVPQLELSDISVFRRTQQPHEYSKIHDGKCKGAVGLRRVVREYSGVANLKNASHRGWSPLVALQIEYNLIERTTERELIPMANEMGLGVVPFSPLSNGLLSGKYSREDFLNKSGSTGFQGSRKNAIETLGKFTQRNMQIVDEVKKVASEVKKSPAQVALAWLLSKSTVTSVLLGASKLEQLENNLSSLNTHLSPDQIKRLDDISRVEMGFPHAILANPTIKQTIAGGIEVHRK